MLKLKDKMNSKSEIFVLYLKMGGIEFLNELITLVQSRESHANIH